MAYKLIRLLKRPSGNDPHHFLAEWRAEAEARLHAIDGLVGYLQNHCLSGVYRKKEPLFDGYAEEYYSSAEARLARCRPDRTWATESASEVVLLPVSVAVLLDGEVVPGAIKSVELIRRRPDVSHQFFDRYWLATHGPLACAIPFMRYEQNHVAADMAEQAIFHGAAVTWFGTTDAMRAAAGLDAYRLIREDEHNFLNVPSPVLLTNAHVLLCSAGTPKA